MTIGSIGVILFLTGILYLLIVDPVNVKVSFIFIWILSVLFCIGGWILSVLFAVVSFVLYELIKM